MVKLHYFLIFSAMTLWLFASPSGATPILVQEGIYQDVDTGVTVEVARDRVPWIVFIRLGPPHYYGFWLNTWTLDAYKERLPSFQPVDLSLKGRATPLNRESDNLYKKSVRDLGQARVELTYEDGSKWGYFHKKFFLVLNTSTGLIEQFSHEQSWPMKSVSWWPEVGNVLLFRMRLHTGPFRRTREGVIDCSHLLAPDVHTKN